MRKEMKIREIKELNNKEILERMEAEKSHLERLQLNHAISPLDNPLQIKEVRRTIARFATELRQREINQ
jgi:large subunit ribosomal protein L29